MKSIVGTNNWKIYHTYWKLDLGFTYTFLLGQRNALTCALLWPRISRQQAKTHCWLISQSCPSLWKDPDNNVRTHPDAQPTAGLASESVTPIPFPVRRSNECSHNSLLQEHWELSNQRSCDGSVLWFRTGGGQLQHHSRELSMYVCFFLESPTSKIPCCCRMS